MTVVLRLGILMMMTEHRMTAIAPKDDSED